MNQQPLFFGWETPWLPRLATYLLSRWNNEEQRPCGDLSTTVVIVPGRRAGRRLLELLALEAEKERVILIPPRIVTLQEAVTLLLILPEGSLPEATEWTCRLAWREALLQFPEHLLQHIQPLSQEISRHHRGEYLLGIIEALAQELGRVGLDFKTISVRVGTLFPETSEREEPRWQALAELEHGYRELLNSWGYIAPNDHVRVCLEQGIAADGVSVLVAGVVESTPFFNSFFEKIDPTILIIAPQEHASGFTQNGGLVTSYWLENPAFIQDSQLITCERSQDQAVEVVRLISLLPTPSENVAVAIPDVTTLPLLQDYLKQHGVETRWAAGLPFLGGRLCQLLKAMADFLDHKNEEGPSLQAIGALVRHPDIQPHCSAPEEFLRQLDALEGEHLPAFLDKERLSFFKKNQTLLSWVEELEKIIGVYPNALLLEECVLKLRAVLLRILGKRQVRSDTWEGHYFLGCLEQLLLILEEIERIGAHVSTLCTMNDFIQNLLDMLLKKRIPEREEPGALELLGWLEMSADDSPCAIITSCYEGSLSSSQAGNPLLPDRLRHILGLSDESSLLARDHYLLQTIVTSREAIIITPRYNGRGEPVRPSRLLMLGTSLEKLPERVLSLTQRRVLEEQKEKHHSASHTSHFGARPVGSERVTSVTVTGLRTYLQSPRLFYLQHVLKLQEFEEAPLEMDAGHFGTLLHTVLGAFGREEKLAQEQDAKKIAAWLRKKLFHLAKLHFAPGPTLPINLQLEEVAQTLDGFATAQAAHCEEGWKIIACEQTLSQPLEAKMILHDGRSMLLQGRIDRIDWHPEQKRWMIIDYKTRHGQDWKRATPNSEHFQNLYSKSAAAAMDCVVPNVIPAEAGIASSSTSCTLRDCAPSAPSPSPAAATLKTGSQKKEKEIFWKDLQLPLYLKLAAHWEPVQQSRLPLPTIENTDLCYFQLPIEPEKAGLSEPFDLTMVLPAWEEANRLMREILDGNFEALGEIDAKRMPTLAALCGVSVLS
ncbi:MAG: PD-(D/E)XK nuclease family protein [Chthoniobacterales bacterium]